MAGIYIHIPFCRKACFYCDFHFSINQDQKNEVVDSICLEILSRADYLKKEVVETIYFGGGTPSLLSESQLNQILETIAKTFSLATDLEITLEANPDDLDKSKALELMGQKVNRLSIGIQSFNDDYLKWMNRAHNAKHAEECTWIAAEAGFQSLNIDLIYGIPGLRSAEWETTVHHAMDLPINHISAYSLTLENATPYKKLVDQGKYAAPKDLHASEHFNILTGLLKNSDWQRYEVSNYCLSENYSRHNTAYWQGVPYLGIGPSAHSYNGNARSWNVKNNQAYVKGIKANEKISEEELLTPTDKYNEQILTSLRTKWGIEIAHVKKVFQKEVDDFIELGLLKQENDRYTLTDSGLLYADSIASSLFEV